MKRNLILIGFLFFTMLASAQFNRNRGRTANVRPDTRTQQKPPEFNVEKTIGLNIYNIEKTLKRIGVKKPKDKVKKISSIFSTFNKKNGELARLNSFAFSETKNNIEYALKQTQKTQNTSFMQKAYKDMATSFEGIIKELVEREKQLDAALEPLLSKKQFKKWKSYKVRLRKNKK
tara:strand:+ start:55062 stop:55586 length:525 start_codon:yes stop_codon:yes gene_type:complete